MFFEIIPPIYSLKYINPRSTHNSVNTRQKSITTLTVNLLNLSCDVTMYTNPAGFIQLSRLIMTPSYRACHVEYYEYIGTKFCHVSLLSSVVRALVL